MIRTSHTDRRAGFTLVELMVSAAIVIIIMAILATAFTTGIDTMRQMRSAGDLMDQLRSAKEMMQYDLKAACLTNAEGSLTPVSGQRADQPGYAFPPGGGGYFHLRSTPVVIEGVDADQIQSTRSNGGHLLQFTAVQTGGSDTNLYSAVVQTNAGPVLAASPAAEVAYFLGTPQGAAATGGTNSLLLFNLYRRQRLVDSPGAKVTQANGSVSAFGQVPFTVSNSEVVAFTNTTNQVCKMSDLAAPANRLRLASAPPNNPNPFVQPPLTAASYPVTLDLSASRVGDDVLLSNVISFEVRATGLKTGTPLWPRNYPPSGTYPASSGTDDPSNGGYTTDNPFDTLPLPQSKTAAPPVNDYVFDLSVKQGNNFVPAQPICVQAVQIKVRVWDPKMKVARQMTLVVTL